MGANVGKSNNEKKKGRVTALQQGGDKSASKTYPFSKRRTYSFDPCSHLDLELPTNKPSKSKRATAHFGEFTLEEYGQLADLKLGETIRKGGHGKRGKPSTESSEANDKPPKKKGSKLTLFNSIRHAKVPPVPHPLDHSPDDTSFEIENQQLASENGSCSPRGRAKSFAQEYITSSPSSISSNGSLSSNGSKPNSSLSYDSDISIASSVSSAETGRGSFIRGSFSNGQPDFDNLIGYSDCFQRNPQRARGRSVSTVNFSHRTTVSDSLYQFSDSRESRESTISELQRTKENEKKKNARFQELSKILAERNVIIELHELSFIRKVGEGAFSEVWEGMWNGVHVAIKKLKSMVDDALFQERFLREVENLRKGNHQNVVMFFGVCLKPPCIVTEYMGGGNLYDLMHKQGVRWSTAVVTKMATDLAVGLLHLHSLSILHRDLTSLNILLDDMTNVKISDFGLSREKQQEGSMTMTLGGICNPRWRPPEITKNIGHYSEKVDVYSFALVVWEMLTGEVPFANLDGPQAAAQVAYTNLRPVIPPTCPDPLRRLIQRCWVDDAKARPDFKDIVEQLKAIQFSNPMGFASELHC